MLAGFLFCKWHAFRYSAICNMIINQLKKNIMDKQILELEKQLLERYGNP
jgi:hypothetical protein